jgi:hypothetical protein
VQCLVSLPDGLAGYTFPLYNTFTVQKPPVGSPSPCLHRAHSTLALPQTEPTLAGPQTVCAMQNAGWPALLAAHSFLLTTNFFIFSDVVGALQTPARAAGCLALPTSHDAFLTALAPHHVSLPCSMNRNMLRLRCAPPPHFKVSCLVWRELAEVAPHHNCRDLAHTIWRAYWALVVAALFLVGTLGSSWFAALEALQNAYYVLTTRGAAPPGQAPLGIGTVAGTLSKCGGTQTEGQVEQQQQRHQAAAHPLLADVDSESVQAAIRRLSTQASC